MWNYVEKSPFRRTAMQKRIKRKINCDSFSACLECLLHTSRPSPHDIFAYVKKILRKLKFNFHSELLRIQWCRFMAAIKKSIWFILPLSALGGRKFCIFLRLRFFGQRKKEKTFQLIKFLFSISIQFRFLINQKATLFTNHPSVLRF